MYTKKILILATVFLILSQLSMLNAQNNEDEVEKYDPVQVMILGTIHLSGNSDFYLSDKGQQQIMDLLDKIEAFQPDKIMLEMPPSYEAKFNALYDAYRDGTHEITANERQQYGMRLANRLGHERLYGVDYSNFLDYRPALAIAEELDLQRQMDERRIAGAAIRDLYERYSDLPLSGLLAELNKPENFQGSSIYLSIAQMGTVEDPQGAIQMMDWWERNMVMFARTALYSEPGDRILFIVGYGHNTLLNQFFEEADHFNVVSPVPFLEGAERE